MNILCQLKWNISLLWDLWWYNYETQQSKNSNTPRIHIFFFATPKMLFLSFSVTYSSYSSYGSLRKLNFLTFEIQPFCCLISWHVKKLQQQSLYDGIEDIPLFIIQVLMLFTLRCVIKILYLLCMLIKIGYC